MSRRILVSGGPGGVELTRDRLADDEMAALRALMQQWETHDAAARLAKERIQLLLLTAKDRRGILGPIEVNPDDGRILQIPKEVVHGGSQLSQD